MLNTRRPPMMRLPQAPSHQSPPGAAGYPRTPMVYVASPAPERRGFLDRVLDIGIGVFAGDALMDPFEDDDY